MEKRTEKTILKVALGFLVVLLLGLSTFLVTAKAANKNPVDFISSIRVADTGDDNGPEISEAEESAQLAPLAKITADEAKTIAIGAVDTNVVGEVKDVGIENENGNVVYAVEFKKDGVETDVKIDARNGKVLLIEDDNNKADIEDSAKKELESDDKDRIDHEFEGDEGDHKD